MIPKRGDTMNENKPPTLAERNAMLMLENKGLKKTIKELTKKEKIQFSKIILGLILISYFAGLILGGFVVIKILLITPEYSVQALISLFSYIGAPTGVAVGFYSWKAKNENTAKIERSRKETEKEE